MKPLPPRQQIAVVRFTGWPAAVQLPVVAMGLIPGTIGLTYLIGGGVPSQLGAQLAIAASVVYSAAAIAAAMIRFRKARSKIIPADPRVDERLSDAVSRAGITEQNAPKLRRRRHRQITDALGYPPPRLWISSRIGFSGIDQQPTWASKLPCVGQSESPLSIYKCLVAGAVCALTIMLALIGVSIAADTRNSDGAWIVVVIAALPPLVVLICWLRAFSTISVGPGRITLHRRWRMWIVTIRRRLLISNAHTPHRGRPVNPADVRVVMVMRPVLPVSRTEWGYAMFSTRGHVHEQIRSWVFIGDRRPRAFRRVEIDAWRLALYGTAPSSR